MDHEDDGSPAGALTSPGVAESSEYVDPLGISNENIECVEVCSQSHSTAELNVGVPNSLRDLDMESSRSIILSR